MRAAELRGKVGPAAQLSPAALARIAARLEAEARTPRVPLSAALAGAAVALAVVATAVLLSRPPRALTVTGSAPSFEPPATPHRTIVVPAAAAPEHAARRPHPVEAPAPVVAEEIPAPTPAPVEAAPAPKPTSPLFQESRLLGSALAKLRSDPARALAALDDYATRFPSGQLAQEAQVMRVDALLGVGRRDRALAALDGMTLAGLPRGRELVVLRAELRSEAGRCREALGDFGVAIAEAADGLDERALYGRALCRARLGNAGGARADLARYLVRFPDGRFAADARHALEK